MRRHFILFTVALLLISAVSVVADEAVLMDFSLLKADILPLKDATTGVEAPSQNRGTMMDFAALAGTGYTDEQKAAMRTSFAMKNWDVFLSSSSRTVTNQSLSYTAEATVADNAKQFPGKSVLGIRVHFPIEPFNSWARVKPPFEVPAFEAKADIDDQGKISPAQSNQQSDAANAKLTRFEGSVDSSTRITTAIGVVKNIGALKSLAVTVKGLNFPESLSVVLKDRDGTEKVIFLGYLNFDGWRELRWDNPSYISEVRNRELKIYSLYPKAMPYYKFDSFLIQRDASDEGGDFVTYIKDIKILYDKAVVEPLRDIDDESIWGIEKVREDERKKAEASRFGQKQVLRYLETLKKDENKDFTKQ
jgi:hypothetical protein